MLLTANSSVCSSYLVYFDTDNVPRYVTGYNQRTENMYYVWSTASIFCGGGWGAMYVMQRRPYEWEQYYHERKQPGYDQLRHRYNPEFSRSGGRWETLTRQEVLELIPQLELPILD